MLALALKIVRPLFAPGKVFSVHQTRSEIHLFSRISHGINPYLYANAVYCINTSLEGFSYLICDDAIHNIDTLTHFAKLNSGYHLTIKLC